MTAENAETTNTVKTAVVAAPGTPVAPEKASRKKGPTKKKGTPKAQKTVKSRAKAGAPKKETPATKKPAKPTSAKQPGTFRPESKGAKILELISRTKGASLAELMKATSWQAHSVRGFISGTLGTKRGLQVESAKREDGERVYSISR
jgi:Protein of unknown function (DUF3489)